MSVCRDYQSFNKRKSCREPESNIADKYGQRLDQPLDKILGLPFKLQLKWFLIQRCCILLMWRLL